MAVDLLLGDCLDVMRGMADNSVDSIVTDPPYGLSFMGKAWDKGVPSTEVWAEALRILKPGGHLLAFAGTRTQHRMAVNIEDAGFEIRDMIAWVYGSGFPKSQNVSKAIDKCNGEAGRLHKFTAWMRTTGLKSSEIDRITDTSMGGYYLTAASQPAIPTPVLWEKLRPHCGEIPAWVDELVERIEAEREVVGKQSGTHPVNHINASNFSQGAQGRKQLDITTPATEAARQWDGWGTALKPALEPITVARKPFKGTVADNVLEHGTGAINVDGCRVGAETPPAQTAGQAKIGTFEQCDMTTPERTGRFPANLIHDGSDEVAALFPGADEKSAARFFYQAKASKADRTNNGTVDNKHPTVKPTDLMRYLLRLVTPPGGTSLDPFMGSGSTGKAAVLEGFGFIGIELDEDSLETARQRIEGVETEAQQAMF